MPTNWSEPGRGIRGICGHLHRLPSTRRLSPTRWKLPRDRFHDWSMQEKPHGSNGSIWAKLSKVNAYPHAMLSLSPPHATRFSLCAWKWHARRNPRQISAQKRTPQPRPPRRGVSSVFSRRRKVPTGMLLGTWRHSGLPFHRSNQEAKSSRKYLSRGLRQYRKHSWNLWGRRREREEESLWNSSLQANLGLI